MYEPRPPFKSTPKVPTRPLRRWYWQVVVAVLLAVLAVEGQPVAASQAAATGHGIRPARVQRAAPVTTQAGLLQVESAAAEQEDSRPDLRVTFGPIGAVEAGQPMHWTVQVRNDGGLANGASVSALVPPGMSNVRASAPGFVCTRLFSASGPGAGTLVTCSRSNLEQGASAEVTIEANAPTDPGTYRLIANADPRDEIQETDEANNSADLAVEVRG